MDGWEQRSIEPTLPGDEPTLDDADVTRGSARSMRLEPAVPDRIGRFVVESRLGVGGMGAVFRAHDPALDRPVALKLLRGEARPDEQARLRREAQALARLSHPHVVKVFEAGLHGTRAYIAMELVDGISLDAWLAARSRTLHEILDAFIQAGEGLAAAHTAGFVHRDFKPSNVMMGADGRVRVLDFGLAWADPLSISNEDPSGAVSSELSPAMWSSDLTRTGALLGTPAYMSPEQLGAKPATEASDQFAFCVAIYQALYRCHPFSDENGGQDLMGNVLTGRLRPTPSAPAVPARIRRAVTRGLSLAPEERWPSIARLLDELRRARRPPTWRRTLAIGTAAVGMLAGGVWLAAAREPADAACSGAEARLAEVWGPSARTRVEQALLGTGLAYAEPTWARVEQGLDGYAASWRATWEDACERTASGRQPAARLDAQLACLERLRRAMGAQIEVLGTADRTVVEQAVTAVAGLQRSEACLDPFDRSLPSTNEDAELAARHEALEQRIEQAAALTNAGKYDEALATAEAADEEARALAHPPIEAAAALRLGLVQQKQGAFEAAEASLDRAYFLAHRLGDDATARRAAVALCNVVGLDRQDYERGLEWARHAEAEAERSPDPLAMADVLQARALVLMQRGEHERALAELERALGLRREHGADDPLEQAGVLADMGIVQRKLERREAAIASQEQALAVQEEALGPDHPVVGQTLHNLAVAYLVAKRKDDAERAIRRSLAIDEAALGPEHPRLATTLSNLGMILERQGRPAEAEQAMQRAIAIMEASGAQLHTRAILVANLALVRHHRGHEREAAESHRKALALFEEAGLERHPDAALTLSVHGGVLQALGELDEADAVLRRALDIAEELTDEHAAVKVEIFVTRAGLSEARGRWDDAIDHAERALALDPISPLSNTMRTRAHLTLARALWASRPGSRAQARAHALEADEASAKLAPSQAPLREEVTAWLSAHADPAMAAPAPAP